MLESPLGKATDNIMATHMPESIKSAVNCTHLRCIRTRALFPELRIRYYECINCQTHYWCEAIPNWAGDGPREVVLVQGFCDEACREEYKTESA